MSPRPSLKPLFTLVSILALAGCGVASDTDTEDITALDASLSSNVLKVSVRPDRSDASALQGTSLTTEEVYIFVGLSGRRLREVQSVAFFLDDPQGTGTPLSTDASAPFDVGGTLASGAAGAFSVSALSPGAHQLTAKLLLRNRRVEWTSAAFQVELETGCQPTTCAAQGQTCGTHPDGCGGTLLCGDCASPTPPPSTFPAPSGIVCSATGAAASQARPAVGAVPNDSQDDREAIQRAMDEASRAGGGTVLLPEGVFVVNAALQVRSNVKLAGAGPKTVIKAGPLFLSQNGPYGGFPLITTNGAVNVTIADLTADQSGDVLDGNRPGRLNEYLVDVRNSRNALVDGVFTRNPFTYSIAVVGSRGFCVRNSNTLSTTSGRYDQLDGIHILDSNTGHVLSNVVDQRIGTDGDDGLVAHTIGAPVYDVVYADNHVRGGRHGAGMQLAFGNHPIYNLKIVNNEFWGSPMGIHNGAYEGNAAVHDVVVGGSASSGNLFLDNGGDAVSFSGEIYNLTVTHNVACRSGGFIVGAGAGNVVRDNSTSCP